LVPNPLPQRPQLPCAFEFCLQALVVDEVTDLVASVVVQQVMDLGSKHPDTPTSVNNLASVLQDQGKNEEAEKMYQQVVKGYEKTLGEDHPKTISAINNLAIMLRRRGRLDEAAAIMQKVLESRKRILGEEHPDTLLAMNNLANALGDYGEFLTMRT
jgi:tetratricopeptide (TPR) repeat protein